MKEVVLENQIVKLRPMAMGDIDAIFEVSADERIWAFLSFTLTSKEAVERYVTEQVALAEQGERIVFVVFDKITNRIIGSTSIFDISEHHARAEIGATWLTPMYWRTSINTNCKYLLLQYMFEELQFERVQLKTDNLNERSQRAIEGIGAQFEGRLRKHMRRKDGTMRDTMMYSIIREDWPSVKHMLEERMTLHEDR